MKGLKEKQNVGACSSSSRISMKEGLGQQQFGWKITGGTYLEAALV